MTKQFSALYNNDLIKEDLKALRISLVNNHMHEIDLIDYCSNIIN